MRRSDTSIKIIGILTMTVDHVGALFFPEYWVLRGIGRIAFPLFAYQLAVGMMHTSNKFAYLSRLFLFGLFAQIPYMLAFQSLLLNILFSLFYAGICLWVWQTRNGKWLLPILVLVSYYLPIEYGIYAVMLPFVFYLGLVWERRAEALIVNSTITVLLSVVYFESVLQMLAIIGIIIVLYVPLFAFRFRVPKYFFYAYYPLHLILFIVVKVGVMT